MTSKAVRTSRAIKALYVCGLTAALIALAPHKDVQAQACCLTCQNYGYPQGYCVIGGTYGCCLWYCYNAQGQYVGAVNNQYCNYPGCCPF